MQDRLFTLLQPAVEGLGYELVGVQHITGGHRPVLRVYIDNEQGITVDDCEKVSRQVSAVLDVEDPIRGEYTLEVSSPGLDRPLMRPEHFQRFAGERVKLRLSRALDGRRKFTGLLGGLDGDVVLLDIDGETFRLPLELVEMARLVPEF
ncbi:MAG: ribosome maturation factor RimP [Chromatiales bacterium]|nr:ribosome maturation factor RimP [Chromatiales bacterium]